MTSTGGRKSRNKVIVGEPAIGSYVHYQWYCKYGTTTINIIWWSHIGIWLNCGSKGCLGYSNEEGCSIQQYTK